MSTEVENLEYPYLTSQLDHCVWCKQHRGIDYLELCSRIEDPDRGGWVMRYPSLTDEGRPIAFVSHAQCGPTIGYPIRLSRLLANPDFWRNHIGRKRWDNEEYQQAFDYLSIRPLPVQTQPDVECVGKIKNTAGIQTYFIQSELGGPVKIGKSRTPDARLKQLQVGHPDRLRIIKLISGDIEGELHQKFAHIRGAGEWFQYTRELTEFLLGANT